MRPWLGLSMMMEPDFLIAALPLFSDEEVETLEWSLDMIPEGQEFPEWLQGVLNTYSGKNRLLGHGVRYSILSGKWEPRHERWLNYLKKEVRQNTYRHFTEHFGFMSSGDFHKGAPLPVPLNNSALEIGRDRLMRLQEAVHLPVGLENLAFSFSADEIKRQGEFLEKLIAPVNGFIILDLHNVWCQALNFNTDLLSLIRSYPLEKVKEIHLSGGSWSTSGYSMPEQRIRRDTHDEAIPVELFELLPSVLNLCPGTEAVIFERLGHTLQTEAEREQYRADFHNIRKIIIDLKSDDLFPTARPEFMLPPFTLSSKPPDNKTLSKQQLELAKLFRESASPVMAKERLLGNSLFSDWNINSWSVPMIETAMQLIHKWE